MNPALAAQNPSNSRRSSRPSEAPEWLGGVVVAPGQWLLWIGVFIAALALFGGSSRPDPIHNAILRPIAALLLIPALYGLRRADWASARAIIVLAGVMLFWMILQVIPLPSSIWQALPGRERIAELDQLAGFRNIWRPLSLSPFRGLNALFGLIPPIAALFLALSARMKSQTVFLAITGLGLMNAALGILQAIGGPKSLFYLYATINRGAPTGIFANENHAAVFSSIVLLVIAKLAVEGQSRGMPGWMKLSLAPAYLIILLAVLISGSRAGLATALLALGAGGVMIWSAFRAGAEARFVGKPSLKSGGLRGTTLLAAGGAAIILVVVAFLVFDRAPAVKDLMANSPVDDLRWSLSPVLITMMGEHWLMGTGFGSFDTVYRIYEPTALLFPPYVNQAHNDWAQLVIEGGLPAVACLLGLIAWLSAAILRIARRNPLSIPDVAFWVVWIVITMAASAVDYPLRTPIFQAVSVWLMLCLMRDSQGLRRDTREPDQS